MIRNKTLLAIALIEIFIGMITILATALSLWTSTNTKAPNVLVFVFLTAAVSSALGVGLLRSKKTAYELLIYFSSIIILSKILIFADIIVLNGALETALPSTLKNTISVFYHGFVIYYLYRKDIKAIFIK